MVTPSLTLKGKKNKTVILEKTIATEQKVRMLEMENTICFEIDRAISKAEVKEEVEDLFEVKVEGVRTHIRKNKMIAYVKLKPEFIAADVATRLGVL